MSTPNYVLIYMKNLKQKWEKGVLAFHRNKDSLIVKNEYGSIEVYTNGEWREDEKNEAINIYNSKKK